MRPLFLWGIVGIIGLTAFLRLYPSAFPEASIDFRIRHHEALKQGAQALQQLGAPDLSRGYIAGVDFHWSETAKRYLEKTMGLEAANEVMREIALWHYYCRWVRTGDRHIYEAAISTDGQVIWVDIRLPEEEPGAKLSERQAQIIAEKFLRERLQLDLTQWRFISATQNKLPHRLDYTFVYEHRQKRFPPTQKDAATLRLWVKVSGDKVTGYHTGYLYVPEWWRFEESRKQTQRAVLMTVFRVAYGVLWLALLIYLIVLTIRKEAIPFRVGGLVGSLLALLFIVTGLNFASLWWLRYNPAQPIGTFLASTFVAMLFGGLLVGFQGGLFALTGEHLSRDAPPAGIPMGVLVRPAFWKTKEAVIALLVGFCLGMAHLGYVTIFYWLGRKVGVWTPLDIPYTDAVVTPLPFLVPLFVGMQPALTEELFFRLAAPYLLWRWTKRWWLSAILPSIVWAFLHVGYPPEPAFTRGLELSLVAMVYVWVMQRYGFLAPVIAHYTYNATLTAQLLLRADELFLRLSGFIAVGGLLLLFLPATVTFLRHRQLPSAAEVPPLVPAPALQPTFEPVPYASYQPIGRKTWLALIALSALGFASGFFPDQRFNSVALMEVNRKEAVAIATDFLRRKGVPTERYHIAASLVADVDEDDDEVAYLLENADRETLYRFWREERSPVYWQVRFFRPLEREEWWVTVNPQGRVMHFSHRLPEEAKGAKLAQKEALQIAETFLRHELGGNLNEWRLVETDHFDRPNRRDWRFIYEHKTRRIGDAPLRMRVTVKGKEAEDGWRWWEVPEAWKFEREQFEAWTSLVGIYFLVLLIVTGIFVIFCEWREGTTGFYLPLGLKVGLPFTFLTALQILNGTANFWLSYPTSLPPIAWLFIRVLQGGLLLVLIAFVVTTLVGSFEPNWMAKRLPEMVPLSVWLSRRRDNPELAATALCHPAALRDAIAFGYLASFASWHLFNETPLNALLLRSSWLPFVDYLAWTAWATLLLLLFGIVFAGTYRRYIRTPQRLFIFLLLLLPAGLIGTYSATEALRDFAEWTVGLFVTTVLLYWLGRFVLRHNLYAWALGLALPMLLSISVQLLQAPDMFWKAQAIPLLALYALPALWWLWSHKRANSRHHALQT
ncbi:CAAX protease self-immunity [Candidatus Fervidibacteria bacterium JGI MDM2 SSWTFF-3-K9]